MLFLMVFVLCSPYDDYYPGPEETSNFLNGLSINGSASILGGGGMTYNPNLDEFAPEVGIFLPQIGISVTYNFTFNRKM
jgi:hypothetical protein